jgi:hypothetical protein
MDNMVETEDLWLALFIIYFAGFFSGFFVRASLSQYRRHKARKEPKPWHARLPAAEGDSRHDGKEKSMNLPAAVFALVVVSGVIVADHFKGPLFPDVFYCLSDGGTQITRMCTGRIADRDLITKSP